MRNKTKGWLFKIPVIVLLIADFFGAIYATVKNISGIGIMTPITIFVIIILYIIGEYFHNKREFY